MILWFLCFRYSNVWITYFLWKKWLTVEGDLMGRVLSFDLLYYIRIDALAETISYDETYWIRRYGFLHQLVRILNICICFNPTRWQCIFDRRAKEKSERSGTPFLSVKTCQIWSNMAQKGYYDISVYWWYIGPDR